MLGSSRGLKVAVTVAGLALAAAACGSSGSGGGTNTGTGGNNGSSNPNTINSANVKNGGSITYVIEKNIPQWNLLTSDGNLFETAEVENGIFPYAFTQLPSISVTLNKDLLESADLTNQSPETIVYKINPKAVWSDGTPISADDFIYTWQADNGTNPNYNPASTTGYEDIQSVVGSDNGKTVTVTFKADKKFPDWKSLFGPILPAHYMKTLDPDPVKAFNDGLKGTNFPKISGGPYIITQFQNNVSITLSKNPKWYGAVKPHLDTIIFRIITDATQEPQALANNEVQAIYPQPQIDLVQQVKQIQGVTSTIGQGVIFEHFDINTANPFLKDTALRQAIFKAVDRKQLIAATVGQFSSKIVPLNNRMLVPTQPGYQDNVASLGYGKGDVTGAKKILTDAGYKITGTTLTAPNGQAVPAFSCVYTTGNQIRQQECELLGSFVKPLGITINPQTTDDLSGSLDGKKFDIIVFAWVGTPFPYSSNKAIYVCNGDSNYDSYCNQSVTDNLDKAAQDLNEKSAQQELNAADAQVTKDAITLPLYQKPTFLAFYSKYGNIRDNATSVGPTYNMQEWGIKTSAS